MTTALRPTAPVATEALLPGDPGRALAIAQELLERPRMSNHHRGLWGYCGETPDGAALTVQSTGLGGPSAAAVLGELAALGLRRAVRVGTGRAVESGLRAGSFVVAASAFALDGTSRALGAASRVDADRVLADALCELAGEPPLAVATLDVVGAPAGYERRGWRPALPDGTVAAERAAAPLMSLARRLGLEVACILVISEDRDGELLADDELDRRGVEAGRLAARALAATRPQPSGSATSTG